MDFSPHIPTDNIKQYFSLRGARFKGYVGDEDTMEFVDGRERLIVFPPKSFSLKEIEKKALWLSEETNIHTIYVAIPSYLTGLLEKEKLRQLGIGILITDDYQVTEYLAPAKERIQFAKKEKLREIELRTRLKVLEEILDKLTSKLKAENEEKVEREITILRGQIENLNFKIEEIRRQIRQAPQEKQFVEEQPKQKRVFKVTKPVATAKTGSEEEANWKQWSKKPVIPDFAKTNPWIKILSSKRK